MTDVKPGQVWRRSQWGRHKARWYRVVMVQNDWTVLQEIGTTEFKGMLISRMLDPNRRGTRYYHVQDGGDFDVPVNGSDVFDPKGDE